MMNLKYYLRGLGIGIIVTALIMGIATGGKEKMSNAEIRERAKALGMVEEGTLLEAGGASQEETSQRETSQREEDKAPEKQKAVGTMEPAGPEGVQNSGELKEPEETPKAVMTPDEAEDVPDEMAETADQAKDVPDGGTESMDQAEDVPETPEADEPEQPQEPEEENRPATGSVTLRIARGDGSYSVCKKLEEAGLIESATEYDMFLYQNGYDKTIRAGTFEIPADANGEKIARIITGLE